METIFIFLIQAALVVIFFILPLMLIIGLFTYKQDETPDISFPDTIQIKIEHVSKTSGAQSPCPRSENSRPSPSSSPMGKEESFPD